MRIWPTVERFLAEQGAAALVTLTDCRGSSPREIGARMVVRPDGGFSGTIGGGALEWLALAEAQRLLARPPGGSLRRLDQALGPDLGQCCGGRVAVTVERFDRADQVWVTPLATAESSGTLVTIGSPEGARFVRRPLVPEGASETPHSAYAKLPDGHIIERFESGATPLYLFGAGHVGRSLVMALAPLPFKVTWIDPRPGGFPPHIPENTACVAPAEPVRLLQAAPESAFVAVMTHSHALDLDIVTAALSARRFAYVGLIGSATKRARFVTAMRKIGLGEDTIARLTCPIGLTAIRDKAPAAIAAGIAAQLLIARDAAAHSMQPAKPNLTETAVRRGAANV